MTTRPYSAHKTESAETWEIRNGASVVDEGLTEQVAKDRAELANEMYDEASKEEAPNA